MTAHEIALSTVSHDVIPNLTPTEWKVVREVALHRGDQVAAAHCLGRSHQTIKNHMTAIHRKLQVSTTIAVYVALGWLTVPSGNARRAMQYA